MEWVDRHGCRESRDGPRMARGGVPTELTCTREPERSEGRTPGASLFGGPVSLQRTPRSWLSSLLPQALCIFVRRTISQS